MPSSLRSFFLFILFILGLIYLIGIPDYLNLRPQGPHQWRQSDCLSFTLNYSRQDNSLFEPEIHNLMSDNGESGLTAGEFPLLYYSVGKIWKVTGQQEWLYRLINLSIFILGLFALFKLVKDKTNSHLAAYFLSGMIFTIPVITFYAPNFLSNITALSFVMMGWYFANKFYNHRKTRDALLMILFFTLAPLLKITALISIIALLGVIAISVFVKGKIFTKNLDKKFWITVVLGTITILGSVYMWYSYASAYNTLHGGWFTFNNVWPIWEMEQEYLSEAFDFVFDVWVWEYFTPAGYFLLAVSFVGFIFWFKSIPLFAKLMLLFMLVGNLLYVLLWFKALRDHDYYIINLYALPIFLWVVVLIAAKNKLVLSSFTKKVGVLAALVLLVSSAVYGNKHLYNRYNGWFNNNGNNVHSSFFDITPYLRNELNVKYDERVITYPDPSYCITLYLADQKGWPMNKTNDIEFIEKAIGRSAKYILVNDSSFYDIEGVDELNLEEIGQHKKITVFKIPD